jgi:hypothetical protein
MSHVMSVMSRMMSSVRKRECAGERESASQHQGCKSHGISSWFPEISLSGFVPKRFKAAIAQFGETHLSDTKSMTGDAIIRLLAETVRRNERDHRAVEIAATIMTREGRANEQGLDLSKR